jgi:ABC-type lipoprotein export system ATPase subunit
MIQTKELVKVFRTDEVETTALNKVDLDVQSGELYFDGAEVSKFKERQRTNLRKGNIGFVYQDFNLILAYEPTGNLDSANGEEVMNLLTELNKEGTTIIMVKHSPSNAEKAHMIVQLFDRHIVTENIKKIL